MSNLINFLEPPGKWTQGIYELSSYEEYASIPALRSSQLKQIGKTPAHYKAAQEYPKTVSSQLQKSFSKGKAFDVLILEGREMFDSIVHVEPDIRRNSNEYKKWIANLPANAIILTETEKSYTLMMANNAFRKECFRKIFNAGISHRVLVWQDTSTGLWCKAEIDWIKPDGTVVDLKTANSADFWFFSRQAMRLNYPHQGAFYLSGLTTLTGQVHDRFQLAVVETEPPFESHVFNVGFDLINKAQVENELRIEILAQCLKNNDWPGYTDQIIDLDSGQYLYDENELNQYQDEEMEDF